MAEPIGKKKLISYYKSVFGTPDGQIVLKDLMFTHYFFETTHVPGDPHAIFLNEGQRSVINRIAFMIKVNPDEFLKQTVEKEANHV